MNISQNLNTPFCSNLSCDKAAQLAQAAKHGLFEKHVSFSIVDFDAMTRIMEDLHSAFPDHFSHAFAVKANYFKQVLIKLKSLGTHAEVAGPGEFEVARLAGFEPAHMVFDAPAKTVEEIETALKLGVTLNIDNDQEFQRIKQRENLIEKNATIGVRINPQIGAGSVQLSSTATQTSKFGIGLCDAGNRDWLINTYLENEWLNAIHTHTGSVGCPLPLMAQGVRTVVDLVLEINQKAGFKKIKVIDIGGGLPVSFTSDEDTPSFSDYARILHESSPELFTGEYKVITEFGRSIIAKAAYSLAKVEYTKVTGGRHIALTHAGAHNMMRIVFQPVDWARRVSALDRDGIQKSGELIPQDVAGPCCFAGDIIAHERPLPLLVPNDYIMVHDTGAYCFSNHFYYNAMAPDPVYSVHIDRTGIPQFKQINAGLTTAELAKIYS